MNFVQPPCPVCGRRVYPMEDSAGGVLCIQGDIESAALAAQRALDDLPVGHPSRAYVQNILDILERHATVKA